MPAPVQGDMDVDGETLDMQLAPDTEETWIYAMRKVLADLRTERPRTEHPHDAAAKLPIVLPPELQVLPDPDSRSAYLREVLRSRLARKSALQVRYDVEQERLFDRREIHEFSRIRAQEDGLREPPRPGENDERRLMERKLRAIHKESVYARVLERSRFHQEQTERLEAAEKILEYEASAGAR